MENWTIINSIELSKLFVKTETEIIISSTFTLRYDIIKFFKSYEIDYTIYEKNSASTEAYFGPMTDFKNLYIISGILKGYGIDKINFDATLKNKIALGIIKRKRLNITFNEVEISEILKLPFNSSINILFKMMEYQQLINSNFVEDSTPKVDEIDTECDFIEESIDDDLEDFDDDLDLIKEQMRNKIEDKYEPDPYEDFRWGGLSGEEAHDAMWNCD